MGYGFSLFRNSADRCNLAVSYVFSSVFSSRNGASKNSSTTGSEVLDTYWDAAISKIPDSTEQHFDEGIQWVRLKESQEDERFGDSQSAYEFSPSFLEELSGAVSNERELLELDMSLQAEVDFLEVIPTRNSLNVLCAVVMKFQRQIGAIISHNKSLPQWPKNDKQFHAARYRRSQLRILTSVTNTLLGDLRLSVGLHTDKPRLVQIVRLEHILLESPKDFLTHFRACLNAGLGTRKAAKIREKQWVECAFTLWMCGLWLWDPCGLKGCKSRSGIDFDSRISQWLCWIHQIYGDSPETGGLVKISRNSRLNSYKNSEGSGSDPENLHKKNGTADYDSEDVLLAESYLRVANAATSKSQTSIYNSAEVTVVRLLWCLKIIRQEGFMCPNLEGNPGEEHDEFILFLEVGNRAPRKDIIGP